MDISRQVSSSLERAVGYYLGTVKDKTTNIRECIESIGGDLTPNLDTSFDTTGGGLAVASRGIGGDESPRIRMNREISSQLAGMFSQNLVQFSELQQVLGRLSCSAEVKAAIVEGFAQHLMAGLWRGREPVSGLTEALQKAVITELGGPPGGQKRNR